MRLSVTILVVGVLASTGSWAWAQELPTVEDDWTPVQRESAVQAARAEASLALIDYVWNLALGPEQAVAGAFNNDPEAKVLLAAACGGAMAESGQPVFAEGLCTVQMSMSVAKLAEVLERFRGQDAVANTLTAEEIAAMVATMKELELDTFITSGQAARPPRPRWQKVTRAASVDSDEYLRGRLKTFWESHCSEQGRIRTVFAAQDAAVVAMAKQLARVTVGPDGRTLRDIVGQDNFAAFLADRCVNDIRPTAIRYYPDELVVDVEINADLANVLLTIKGYIDNQAESDEATVVMLEDVIIDSPSKIFTSTGSARVAEEYVLVGDDPVYLLSRWVQELDGVPTVRVVGQTTMPAQVDDVDAVRAEAFAAAGFRGRLQLPAALRKTFLTEDDADEPMTLGDMAAEHAIVADALTLLAIQANAQPGVIDAEGVVTVPVEVKLSRLPTALVALRRVEKAASPVDD